MVIYSAIFECQAFMEGKLITTYNVHWISLLTVHNTLFLFCHGCPFTVVTEMTFRYDRA
ncbi:hypothetical protein C0J52_14576 [Blattella germanica]|nr:hypothetical protein C0J52_14576 [Blattella germanica]